MKQVQITAFCGSIHRKSSNQIILEHIKKVFKTRCDIQIFPIESLPYFTPGVRPPEPVLHLYNVIERADALIFATPEYIFSLPGILKNMLEWLVSTTLLDQKPTALIVAAADGSYAYASLNKILETFMVDLSPELTVHIRGIKGKIRSDAIKCRDTIAKIQQPIHHLLERIHHSEEQQIPESKFNAR